MKLERLRFADLMVKSGVWDVVQQAEYLFGGKMDWDKIKERREEGRASYADYIEAGKAPHPNGVWTDEDLANIGETARKVTGDHVQDKKYYQFLDEKRDAKRALQREISKLQAKFASSWDKKRNELLKADPDFAVWVAENKVKWS